MKRIGKVLILRNQVYHKPHAGVDYMYSKDCKECKKNTRGDIVEEDEKVDELKKQFEDLGFTDIYGGTDSFVQKDKTKEEMIELLKTAVDEQDFSQDYCFICVILSYGKDGVITCIPEDEKDETCLREPPSEMQLPLAKLQNCLKGDKCEGLLAKPKIFMLQLEGVPKDSKDGIKDGFNDVRPEPPTVKIPKEADFLTYTCDKKVINAWIEGLKNYVLDPQKNGQKPMEIQRLLTRMTKIFKSQNEGMTVEYPCVTSLLTKQVFLTKTAKNKDGHGSSH